MNVWESAILMFKASNWRVSNLHCCQHLGQSQLLCLLLFPTSSKQRVHSRHCLCVVTVVIFHGRALLWRHPNFFLSCLIIHCAFRFDAGLLSWAGADMLLRSDGFSQNHPCINSSQKVTHTLDTFSPHAAPVNRLTPFCAIYQRTISRRLDRDQLHRTNARLKCRGRPTE